MSETIPTTEGRIQQQDSVAAIGGGLSTTAVPAPRVEQKLSLCQTVQAIGTRDDVNPPQDCWKCETHLMISVFFDGTGNNLDADLPTLEHSNVARMYRAHLKNAQLDGSYRIYVPGIGTYFPEIGDDGCNKVLGFIDTHNGMGAMGQARLDYAFRKIQEIVADSEPRCKRITMISLSVFGFSRGATLARAFLRDLLKPELGFSEPQGTQLRWKSGGHPLEIRFVGLWDTVASVGLPMSANNAKDHRSPDRTEGNMVRLVVLLVAAFIPIVGPIIVAKYGPRRLDAATLAVSPTGADPAPGGADGHADWADGLAIPGKWIKGRCVHMIAAHEQRNSFPLDSVLRGSEAPSNTEEFVYPGMHSDVGGGYRPGEGGRGSAARADVDNTTEASSKPSQITLQAMYEKALAAGVPLYHPDDWKPENEADFKVSRITIDLFNHYMALANTGNAPLGDAVLAHMRLYFAWRFRHIRNEGRTKEGQTIQNNEKVFAADTEALEAEKNALLARRLQLENERDSLRPNPNSPRTLFDPATPQSSSEEFSQARQLIDDQISRINGKIKATQARIDTLPSHDKLARNLKDDDKELLSDVRSIAKIIADDPSQRSHLRPHYRNLLEAYEAEYDHDKGLRDEKIIAFFADHIHDSLGDFDADFTLPSDPRVIYIGGDSKLPYAVLEDSLKIPRNQAANDSTDQATA